MWLFVVIKPWVCAYGAGLVGDLHTAPLVIKPPPLRQKGRYFKGNWSTPAVFLELVTISGRREGANMLPGWLTQKIQVNRNHKWWNIYRLFICREQTKASDRRWLLNLSAGLFHKSNLTQLRNHLPHASLYSSKTRSTVSLMRSTWENEFPTHPPLRVNLINLRGCTIRSSREDLMMQH